MKLVVVLTCVLVMLSGCITETTGPVREADPEKQLESLIDLGVGYISNGEYARAKENLTRALDLDPRSPEANNAIALLFQLEGEIQLAETHFKKAIKYSPGFSQARNNYGAFLYQEKRYKDAVDQLQRASEDRFYQYRSQVFENLGVSYLQLNKNTEAEQAFMRSIQLKPSQLRSLIELAEIRLKQRNYVEAREFYRRHKSATQQSARSLWICIRLARVFNNENEEASCSLTLRNVFPKSEQYEQYKSTTGQ